MARQFKEPDFAFGDRLLRERERKGFSQTKLACLVGTTQSTYKRWENNGANPSLFFIRRLCEVLQVSADELLGINVEI